MKTNQKFLLVFTIVTIAFAFVTLLYLPTGLIIQFNTSESGVSELSKYLVVALIIGLSLFVGFQLYDEKNKGDYTRWYISSIVVMAVEIFIIVVNT